MADKYYGHGGSYVVDPKTGGRQLVERTGEKAEPAKIVPMVPDDADEVE